MPTCDFCDGAVPAGATECPTCHAPRDPSGDQREAPAPVAPSPAAPTAAGAPAGAAAGAPPQQGAGVQRILEGIQKGDAGGVASGLQDMVKSGDLDLGKLASDLGVGGGGSAGGGGGGLDLGQIARSLTGGGSGASNVLGALGKQGGAGVGNLLKGAAQALKSPTGLAVGGAALAAAGIGAGILFARTEKGQALGAGIKDALGKVIPGGGGGGVGAMLAGSGPSAEEAAQYRQIAEQLPPARPDQLREGEMVLARWEGDEWRPGQLGWVDGGQARVTFESGFERWCPALDLRLLPKPGEAPPAAAEPQAPAPVDVGAPTMAAPQPRRAPSLWDDEPRAEGAFSPNEWVDIPWGPGTVLRGEIVEVAEGGSKLRVRMQNGQEAWVEPDKVRKL